MNKTIEEIRNETDANIYIDRAIAMLKEKCEGEYLVAGYNGIVSLLHYAKQSHQFQQEQKQELLEQNRCTCYYFNKFERKANSTCPVHNAKHQQAEQTNPVSDEDIKAMAEKKYPLNIPKRNYKMFPGGKKAAQKFNEEVNAAHSGDELKPEIICLCGSTRFAKWFMIKRWELEKKGLITLGINILPDNYFAEGNSHGAEQENVKEILDELHKRKIDISDKVFILNVGGYIGESTRNEIDYALSIGKPIEYLESLTT